MTPNDHPNEDELLGVLTSGENMVQPSAIELHVSNCDRCLARLKVLANDDWLNNYRDCLTKDLLSQETHIHSSMHRFTLGNSNMESNQRESEFERDAIHGMLQKILAKPIHPETLGRLGRYEIESIVGVGGMGLVLRGFDRELQRPVAIKMISPRISSSGTARQRFAREARAVAAILHPNVVAIHGINETNGIPWFVMPFIAGPSLRQLVAEAGPLPEREIVRIGLQIASGLAAAHGQGLVHRDIKPENVLVDNQINRVVITDFGLVQRESDETITQTGVLAGTLSFMSPEQTRGQDVDGRSDLFSLGSLLYFLATGSAPFRSETPVGILHQVSNVKHADVRILNPEITSTLGCTIDKLLAKKTTQRFQSAAELEIFLAGFVAHLNTPTKHRLPKLPSLKTAFARWLPAAFLVATLVALSIGIFQFFGPSSTSTTTRHTVQQIGAKGTQDKPNPRRHRRLKRGALQWTPENAAKHAASFNDPNEWEQDYLAHGLKQLKEMDKKRLALPFPFTAFPAPNYDLAFEYLGRHPDGIGVKAIKLKPPFVGSLASFQDQSIPNIELIKPKQIEPLMTIVAAGETPLKNVEQHAFLLNFPHYFFQGSFTNTAGDIDWLAVRTGNGRDIGIVNGRILDLSLGNLIFVRQMQDGSIRIFQHRTRIESIAAGQLDKIVDEELAKDPYRSFFHKPFSWPTHDASTAKTSPFDSTFGWTSERLSIHADNFNNSQFWNKELLSTDTNELQRPLPQTKSAMPFPWLAFPVPYYLYNDMQYGGLSVGPLKLPKELPGFMASINRKVDPKTIPQGKDWSDVMITEPLMIMAVKGNGKITSSDQWAISRSLPHMFFQGFYETDSGQIDWVAFRMQDGTELGIVNGRVIDLSQGNLILINQHESGMITIYQSEKRVGPATIEEVKSNVVSVFSNAATREYDFIRQSNPLKR